MRTPNLAVILCCAVTAVVAYSQDTRYPTHKGPVNDYADKLKPFEVEDLTTLIRTYERQTSIEVAVVVIDSLQGQSARAYAEGIGDYWGVGKPGRNNGIVLLWAPTERAYSLRLADGLAPDLSDEDASRITQEYLLPNFRSGEYYAGLKQTVLATMQYLGHENWEERIRARREAEQARHQHQIFSATMLAGIAVLLGAGVLAGVLLYRSRKRREKLAEMAAAEISVNESLRAAQQNAAKIQQLLSDFIKEAPEQDLSQISNGLEGQPARIATIQRETACLNFTDLRSYGEVLRMKDDAETEAGLLRDTQMRLSDIRSAKERSRQLMEQMSKEKFEIKDVRDLSRQEEVNDRLYTSRQTFDRARQQSSMSVFDWLLIQELLNSSQDHMQKAVQVSQAEPYTPDPTSTFDSTTSFTSGSSTSFSGGDSSGGGGGFSGGTGSDGSY